MPLISISFFSSTESSLAPNTGAAFTAAYFRPGTLASIPNCAVPSTLLGISSLGMSFPTIENSLDSFNLGDRLGMN